MSNTKRKLPVQDQQESKRQKLNTVSINEEKKSECEQIWEIINKYKNHWKNKTSTILEINERGYDSDTGYGQWMSNQKYSVQQISAMLEATLNSLNNNDDNKNWFNEAMSHICGCIFVISGFYARLDEHYYYNSGEDGYQFEMDQWEKIVNNKNTSFDEKMFCVKVVKQFFDTLNYYQKLENHTFGSNNCVQITNRATMYLLNMIHVKNIKELAVKYNLWEKYGDISFNNDRVGHFLDVILQFFPQQVDKADLFSLCSNGKLHLFIEFISEIKIFQLLHKIPIDDDEYWFEPIHRYFENLCGKYYENNETELQNIQQIYLKYINFLQQYFSIDQLEQYNNDTAILNYIQTLISCVPEFIDVTQVDYFQYL
eukprot:464537_1